MLLQFYYISADITVFFLKDIRHGDTIMDRNKDKRTKQNKPP